MTNIAPFITDFSIKQRQAVPSFSRDITARTCTHWMEQEDVHRVFLLYDHFGFQRPICCTQRFMTLHLNFKTFSSGVTHESEMS